MAKKIIVIMILAAFGAAGAFAQPKFRLSGGVGEYITSDFGGGVEATARMTDTWGEVWQRKIGHMKTPYGGAGVFWFLDATYVELNMGLFGAFGSWEENRRAYPTRRTTIKHEMVGVGGDIGLTVKYPFSVNEKLEIFPLLGITYRTMLMTLDNKEYENSENFDTLWFKFGGGFDYSFIDIVYLRVGILYGFRLKNKYEKDTNGYLDSLLNYSGGIIMPPNSPTRNNTSVDSRLGHGLEIKCAVGFRFY
jgi:hypothetical protein